MGLVRWFSGSVTVARTGGCAMCAACVGGVYPHGVIGGPLRTLHLGEANGTSQREASTENMPPCRELELAPGSLLSGRGDGGFVSALSCD